jgi:hypothetical protein
MGPAQGPARRWQPQKKTLDDALAALSSKWKVR